MSACDDYRFLVPLFLDNESSGNEVEDFRKHIANCADCRQLLVEEQALSQLLHRTRPLYQASEVLRARVSEILSSGNPSDLAASERLRQRILRILVFLRGSSSRRAIRWTQLAAVGLATILVFLFLPSIEQHVRANAFVEAAAETHRSSLQGNLPMELHTSSPADVTA